MLYLITDRRKLAPRASLTEIEALIDFLTNAAASGVDMIQIRERDLPTRDLYYITKRVLESTRPFQTRVFVNDRVDVAAALPGVGVHLTTRSLPVRIVRAIFGDSLKIGASTHTLEEVKRAEYEGADFAVFGPVFDTESKRRYGSPVGVESLRQAVSEVSIPVLALGGIGLNNFKEVLDVGCAGLAGISIFAGAVAVAALVRRLKGLPG